MSKGARFTLDQITAMSPAIQKQVGAALEGKGGSDANKAKITQPAQTAGAGARLRQKSKGLNKTETRFCAYLPVIHNGMKVHAQAITFSLGNGVRYTPDFVIEHPSGQLFAYEVKGFMRDDAAVKIKVAASTYRAIQFWLTWWSGDWRFQRILP
jgi:hypothetical protein